MKQYKILYAEDDESLAYLTKDNLELNNFKVEHFTNGEDCLDAFNAGNFDICILDIMLPKIDGFDLAKAIRKKNADVPIIFLSAKTLKEDKLKGLRLGADDYLVKPFSIEELILKINIFLNRSKKQTTNEQTIYHIGNVQFDSANYLIIKEKGKENINLTQREAELLKLFLDNKNMVLKREKILTELWGSNDYFLGRSLDVFVSRLRKIFQSEINVSFDNIHSIGFKCCIKDK